MASNMVATNNFDSMRHYLETFHDTVHCNVGGHMCGHQSPADPVFWAHHAMIDRMWDLWQDCHEQHVCQGSMCGETLQFANFGRPISPPGTYGEGLFTERLVSDVFKKQHTDGTGRYKYGVDSFDNKFLGK